VPVLWGLFACVRNACVGAKPNPLVHHRVRLTCQRRPNSGSGTFREEVVWYVTVRGFLPVAGVMIASIAGVSIKELVTVLFAHLARVCVDRVTRCGEGPCAFRTAS